MAQILQSNVEKEMESQADSGGEDNFVVVERHGSLANSESDSDVSINGQLNKRNMTSSHSRLLSLSREAFLWED